MNVVSKIASCRLPVFTFFYWRGRSELKKEVGDGAAQKLAILTGPVTVSLSTAQYSLFSPIASLFFKDSRSKEKRRKSKNNTKNS